MTSTTRALLFGALLASASPTAVLAADAPDAVDAPPTVSGVIVTARSSEARDKLAPSTTETVTAHDIADTVNAVNIEDDLKYLPDVFIRKRHVGDTQAPMATRTSGVGASARSVIYVDGLLISALIGNNNTNASPRWGMAPEQAVSRIDMLYGPFSAAYPGNSIGGVVEITTRMPDHFEGEAKVLGSLQDFSLYRTHNQYGAGQASVLFGNRWGPLAARLSWQHTDSSSQPLGIATTTPTGTTTSADNINGGLTGVNRANMPILIAGVTSLEHQVQDNQTFKASYDLTPRLQLAYTFGHFSNNTHAHSETYLSDAATGAPVYSAPQLDANGQAISGPTPLRFGGFTYGLPNATFANGNYHLVEDHWMNGLTAKYSGDSFTGRLTFSNYSYGKDAQRLPNEPPPTAASDRAGTITYLDGTGWTTVDADGVWRPGGDTSAHAIAFGLHADRFNLASLKYNTANWIDGAPTSLSAASRGDTKTAAAYVQDVWSVTPTLKLTTGIRLERWEAIKGYISPLAAGLPNDQPENSAARVSPKVSAEWRPDGAGGHWRLTGSYGDAYRFPTVTELYLAVSVGGQLRVANPNLTPEHARSAELAAEWTNDKVRARLSLFNEDVRNALISQTALVPNSNSTATFVQNIDRTIATGAEAVFERKDLWIEGFDLMASVTYLDPHISSDPALPAAVGKQIPQVPKWRSTVTATWRPTDKWTFSTGARYSSRLYGTIDNSDTIGHTYQGFEGYLIIDARASYRMDDHWQAAIGVDNANDRSYFLFHPFPQRSVTAELSYKF
jgi:iron complex outermembrane receptor protein